MKNLKRMIAVLLAMAMTMGMSLTAMADETGNTLPALLETGEAGEAKTITIKAPDLVSEDEPFKNLVLHPEHVFTEEELSKIFEQIPEDIIRIKGYVHGEKDTLYFNYVLNEYHIFTGSPKEEALVSIIGTVRAITLPRRKCSRPNLDMVMTASSIRSSTLKKRKRLPDWRIKQMKWGVSPSR